MKKEYRVVKVVYIESKLTLSEAMHLKRKLNNERTNTEKWQLYYKYEKMES
jgi:hypothetical protein